MKRIAALLIALTVISYASSALAATPVFSKNPADYGAAMEQDATLTKIGLTVDVQLAQGIKLADMPTFEGTYGSTCPWSSWPSVCDIWDSIKAEKIFVQGYFLLPLGNTNIVPAAFSCEVIEAATSDKGDKVRCTQKTKVDMGGYNLDEYRALLEYYYIWLVGSEPVPTYKVLSVALNGASLVSKGLVAEEGAEEAEEEDAEEEVTDVTECDISDPALDCDSDGILNADDLCASEYGEGDDGCPISSADVGAGGTTTVSDGGGCSSIAPAAAPNASAFLMMALALMPLAIRRRK